MAVNRQPMESWEGRTYFFDTLSIKLSGILVVKKQTASGNLQVVVGSNHQDIDPKDGRFTQDL